MSYPSNKDAHDYNEMCSNGHKHEQFIMQKAQEYGIFCIAVYKKNLPLITFEDYIKIENEKADETGNNRAR
jgi:hypothetical protein